MHLFLRLLPGMILLELLLRIENAMFLRFFGGHKLEYDDEELSICGAVFEHVSESVGTLLVRSCHGCLHQEALQNATSRKNHERRD